VWVADWKVKLCDPSLTRAISEHLRDDQLVIKRYTNKASFTFKQLVISRKRYTIDIVTTDRIFAISDDLELPSKSFQVISLTTNVLLFLSVISTKFKRFSVKTEHHTVSPATTGTRACVGGIMLSCL